LMWREAWFDYLQPARFPPPNWSLDCCDDSTVLGRYTSALPVKHDFTEPWDWSPFYSKVYHGA
jgi:hypothetical protein